MERAYAVDSMYVGKMTGKISCTSNPNQLIISVTDPFNGEISVRCDNKIDNTYSEAIFFIEPQSEHIEEYNKCYYHIEEEDFYITQYENGRIAPKKIYPVEIIEHTKDYQKLRSHFGSLRKLHKGQFCSFSGYAIDRNNRPMHPSTVESSLNKYQWFYNPFSFEVAPLDENTIDDFVEETPISKEMADRMVLYHQEQDKIKQQKEKTDKNKRRIEWCKTRSNKINAHIKKYEANL